MNNYSIKKVLSSILKDNNLVSIILAVVITGFFIYKAGYVIGKLIYYFKH